MIEIFKCRIPKSSFILKDGTSLIFAPAAASPVIGFIATSDPEVIAQLQGVIKSQGLHGGNIYQDNSPVDLPEVKPLTLEEQRKAIKKATSDLEADKQEASDEITRLAHEAALAAKAGSLETSGSSGSSGMGNSSTVQSAAKST